MKRPVFLLVSLAAAVIASATTYVRVEKDGTKTYSDRPLPGGQPVEIQPVQSYSAPKQTVDSNLPAEQRALQAIDDFRYSSCSLSPANDETFTNPENVQISVTTTPAIRAGDQISVAVDGRELVSAGLGQYVYAPVERGEHSVQLSIKDGGGRELCSARTVFHVFQPTLNSPARRPRR
jgi:hypothetical protein